MRTSINANTKLCGLKSNKKCDVLECVDFTIKTIFPVEF